MQKKKVLAGVKGFRGRARNCIRIARNRYEKSLLHAYVGRKLKAREFRSLFITRINAGARLYGLQYNQLIDGLKKMDIDLNRKMLSELAIYEPYTFRSIVEQVKASTKVSTIHHLPKLGHVQTSLVTNKKVATWQTARAAQTQQTQLYLMQHYKDQKAQKQAADFDRISQEAMGRKPTVTA